MRRSSLVTFGMAFVGAAVLGSVGKGLSSMFRSEPGGGVRVVVAWPAGPFEARVAFDRPVDAVVAKDVVGRTIALNEITRTLQPNPVMRFDRLGTLRVAAAKLVDDGQTLVLTTDPHSRAGTYSLEIPGVKPAGARGPGAVYVARYDLTGVEASWEGNEPGWSGWLPIPDPYQALALVTASAEHARLAGLLKTRGTLTLATNLTLPKGPVIVRITSDAPLKASLGGEPAAAGEEFSKGPAVFRIDSTGEPTPLDLTVRTGEEPARNPPRLQVSIQTGGETMPRVPVARDDFGVTWAPPIPPRPGPLTNVPKLTGGDPARGAAVFKSAEAKCANCHRVGGEGGTVGPDLSKLADRGLNVVYRDIFEPSAEIHPDYVSYTLVLKDGRVLVGTVRAEGAESLRVADTEAKSMVIAKADIEEIRASATSIMPVGLIGVIGEDRLRDLLAFLTKPAPATNPK